MSIEELSTKGSPACQEAFANFRGELKAVGSVEETVEYEPLKEIESPSYNFLETPRVLVFFGEKLEVFLSRPEKAIPNIKTNKTIPETLRAWVNRAQLGGMSRLLQVQLGRRTCATPRSAL